MPFTAVLRDLNKLNTFVRVAQRRSFTKAAAELRTTPSVVSKRMKELEESLGFSLLNRSTHGLVLTEAGEGLFQQCLEMLARLDDYVTERRKHRDRTVRHLARSGDERLCPIHSRTADDQICTEASGRPGSPVGRA
jgi:DNA-binding transcriptional LysR family regulator